ncbi:MAG: hypothetical protein ABI365_09445, partial [Lysobacteraceae bacterium]
NHLRRTLTETMKLSRYPALLAVSVPARTRAIHGPQTLRAFPTPPTAMLGSLYGARARARQQSEKRASLFLSTRARIFRKKESEKRSQVHLPSKQMNLTPFSALFRFFRAFSPTSA